MALTVRYERVFDYVDGALEEVVSQLKLKKVPGGTNVSLLLPYDEGVYCGARELESIRTASPL